MGFIKMLIGLPLIAVIIIFAFVNNDLANFSLWPFNIEISVSLSVAIIFFILFGFLLGEFFAWLSNAPVRKALRNQKKQNRKLSKEQQKLVREMENLHENLVKTVAPEAPVLKKNHESLGKKFKNLFHHKSEDVLPKSTVEPHNPD